MTKIKIAALIALAATQVGTSLGADFRESATEASWFSNFLSHITVSDIEKESAANLQILANSVNTAKTNGIQINVSNKNFVNQDFRSVFSSDQLKKLSINFSGCNLQGANLEGLHLCGALFNGANLSGANFKKTNLSDLDDENKLLVTWPGHPWYNPNFIYSDTSFDGANISGALFDNAVVDLGKFDSALNREKASLNNLKIPYCVRGYLKSLS